MHSLLRAGPARFCADPRRTALVSTEAGTSTPVHGFLSSPAGLLLLVPGGRACLQHPAKKQACNDTISALQSSLLKSAYHECTCLVSTKAPPFKHTSGGIVVHDAFLLGAWVVGGHQKLMRTLSQTACQPVRGRRLFPRFIRPQLNSTTDKCAKQIKRALAWQASIYRDVWPAWGLPNVNQNLLCSHGQL